MRWKMTDKGGKNPRHYQSQKSAFLRAAQRITKKGSVELEERDGWAKFSAGTKDGKFTIWGKYTHAQKVELERVWRLAVADLEAVT